MDTSKMCPYCMREDALEYGQCRYCHKKIPEDLPLGILPPGTVLGGRYVTGMYLGSGGYGITYRALDLMTNTRVAIKEYRPKQFCERSRNGSTLTILREEEYRYGLKHFYTEVEILASLQFIPEVVRYYNSFAENNTAYYVMEFLDGKTLHQILRERKGNFSYTDTVRLLLPAMLAFHRVFEAGVLHRDISPDNIFIFPDGSIKLIDFGASRTKTSKYSNSFMPVEKEGYSPPEQHTLDREGSNQGPWSDVYAMAGTIYHCIVGKRPPASSARLAGDQLELDKVRMIDEKQKAVLEKNLSLKREERCSTMLAFAKELVDALKEKDAQPLREKFPERRHGNSGQVPPWTPPEPPVPPEPPAPLPGDPSSGIMLWQVLAFLMDMLLFQGVPFALCRLLEKDIWIWLPAGFVAGVLICAYCVAYFLGGSPGETLFRLHVRNKSNMKPNGLEAAIYSFIYLFWPLIPIKLVFKLVSGKNLDMVISGCSVMQAGKSEEIKKTTDIALQFEEGNYKGNCMPLKPGTHIFGRDPEKCNMVYPLSYTDVSREQFVLKLDEAGNLSIMDTSSYGTWLNQSKLPKNAEVKVNIGNRITFGNNKEKIIVINQGEKT